MSFFLLVLSRESAGLKKGVLCVTAKMGVSRVRLPLLSLVSLLAHAISSFNCDLAAHHTVEPAVRMGDVENSV
jgi:hypothetical protein